jgi:hypothetical protein
MKIYNESDFIDIIRSEINPLSREEFYKTEQLGKLWDKFDDSDIRVVALKTKKSWYDWCYDFIHSDEPLKLYFQRRLSYVEPMPVNTIPIMGNEIKLVSNNVRFIRNVNLPSMLDSMGYDGMSIKVVYKNALEVGKIDRCMTMPSVFKDSYIGNYETFVVTMKTITGQMSVFSPTVYRSLLIKCDEYSDTVDQKMLIPSASWCSPILATTNSTNYRDIHIVDVQKDVLDTIDGVLEEVTSLGIFGPPYDLKTFCISSENMSVVVDDDYDKIFFCPPYYDLELYGGSDEQSTNLYSTYSNWLDGYWRKTVDECNKVLKSGGLFCFVMGRFIRGYMMGDDMMSIAKERFELLDEIKILPPLETTRGLTEMKKYEICYIMRKVDE